MLNLFESNKAVVTKCMPTNLRNFFELNEGKSLTFENWTIRNDGKELECKVKDKDSIISFVSRLTPDNYVYYMNNGHTFVLELDYTYDYGTRTGFKICLRPMNCPTDSNGRPDYMYHLYYRTFEWI